jgi:hypothetical protein
MESRNMAKQCVLDNLKIAGMRGGMNPAMINLNRSLEKSGNILGDGNLFDSIYTRQQQWKNFYNISTDDQFRKMKLYEEAHGINGLYAYDGLKQGQKAGDVRNESRYSTSPNRINMAAGNRAPQTVTQSQVIG